MRKSSKWPYVLAVVATLIVLFLLVNGITTPEPDCKDCGGKPKDVSTPLPINTKAAEKACTDYGGKVIVTTSGIKYCLNP